MLNKAAAGTGSIPLSAAVVSLGLYYSGSHPPEFIVLAWQVLINMLLAYPAIYFTPHQGASPDA